MKPHGDVECEDGFSETFIENGENGLVSLMFAALTEKKKALLAFWKNVFSIESKSKFMVGYGTKIFI